MTLRIPYYSNPFAVAGDLTTVPVPVQPDGSLSYNQGWGVDYQRDQTTDPLAKDIDRRQMNQLLNTITALLRQYQAEGFPEFIAAVDNGGTAFPYEIGTVVRYRVLGTDPFVNYVSLVANNTALPSVVANWQPLTLNIATNAQAQAGTIDTALITPAKLAAAIQRSMGANGFFRMPGVGAPIIQWGQFTQNDIGTGPVNFSAALATAFPNGPLQGTMSAASGNGAGGISVSVEGMTTTTITGFTFAPSGSRLYRYIIIGW